MLQHRERYNPNKGSKPSGFYLEKLVNSFTKWLCDICKIYFIFQMNTYENVSSWIVSLTVCRCVIHFKIGTHIFLKTTVYTLFVIYPIKKNISIQGLNEALGVCVGAEGAEYDNLEETNIGKMDNLFKTESETSGKEAENYKFAICQKMYIDNKELCDDAENKESKEDSENNSGPYCQ